MAMLRLSLRDFVIVESLELDFASGFTALTGETGAGKSILIDAIQLLLGQRGDATVVREGASRCELSAEFDTPSTLTAWLDEQGFDSQEATLLLRRQIDAQGRSRAWINGTSATLAQLKALSEHVVDIHGQHAWHSLTRAAAQLDLLDAYAGVDTRQVQRAWQEWQQAQQELEAAQSHQSEAQAQRERLQWQVAEVDKLSPGLHEWDDLNASHTRASHAQALLEAAQSSSEALANERGGAQEALYRAIHALEAQAKWEPRFTPWLEVLQQAQALISDTAHDIHSYARRDAFDADDLRQLDERLSLWLSLSKRFRCAPESLAEQHQEWQAQLDRISKLADLDALQAAVDQAQQAWHQHAQALSQQRQGAAKQLAQAVTDLMQDLGMAGGRMSVQVQTGSPGPAGHDDVAFLVAGHAGVTARPVAKVASGGELSRIALAIAVTTSRLGSVETLIFDEVDSGIGGQIAHTVGDLMRRLGDDRQVLAITHLPQVAATAHHHLKVEKQQSAQGTSSRIRSLDTNERTEEIARMLGGSRDSASVMAHAREILKS